jgi:hypothetical protein
MVRPLKYGEKTSVRSVTIPDSMWEALPEPRSQWVVESIRQFLGAPWYVETSFERTNTVKAQAEGAPIGKMVIHVGDLAPGESVSIPIGEPLPPGPPLQKTPIEEFLASVPEPIRSEVPKQDCPHPKARQVNVIGGKKCLDCGKVKGIQGTWT